MLVGIVKVQITQNSVRFHEKGGNQVNFDCKIPTVRCKFFFFNIFCRYEGNTGRLQDIVKRIKKYCKNPPINKVKGSNLTRTILEDFPIIARL